MQKIIHNRIKCLKYGEKWSGKEVFEEYIPCCYCLEEGAREGTEVPVEWEENS